MNSMSQQLSLTLPVLCMTVSLENILVDVGELEKGMERTKKEHELRSRDRDPPAILKDFLSNSEDKMKKILADAKSAQVCLYQVTFTSVCDHNVNDRCGAVHKLSS